MISTLLWLFLAGAEPHIPRVDSASAAEWAASSDPATALAEISTTDEWTEDDLGGDDWNWVDRAARPLASPARKSPWLAVAASALLPGLGERYLGETGRAKAFFLVEGAIWTTFTTYRIQGETRKSRFIEFAERRGGAARDQVSDYYEHIGFWNSLEEWHDIVRRDARAFFPDDPSAQEEFFERNKRYDESQSWEWVDFETRQRYRQLRSKSERAYRNSRLALGGALLNRFASMVDALATTRRVNREANQERARLELHIVPEITADGFALGSVLQVEY